jgi:hypothetical protein
MPFYTRPNFEDRQVVQYSGTSISLSGDTNVDLSGNLRIKKGAFPGLIATSLDSDGTVVWGPISGVSWSVSACTSPLYVNNLVSCPSSGGTIQVDAGNLALNSELNFLISLSAGTNTDEVLVVDNNGYVKTIPNLMGIGNMWHIPVGYTLTVPDNYQSFVYGDILIEGTIDLQTNAQLVILNGNIILSGGSIVGSGTTYLVTLGGGSGCCFTGGTGSCITDLYVTNIHGCSPINVLDPTYFTYGSFGAYINSGSTVLKTDGGNVIFYEDDGTFERTFNFHDQPGVRDQIIFEINEPASPETTQLVISPGSISNRFVNNSTNNSFQFSTNGFIFSSRDTTQTSGITFTGIYNPFYFPGNGIQIQYTNDVYNPFQIGNRGNLLGGIMEYYDLSISGKSIVFGSIDGMPTAKFDIAYSGGSNNLRIREGAQNGYVLTSDSDGYATWQPSTGGGGGTGINPYYDLGSQSLSITWDVSGNSINYEVTLTGNTDLDLINVRNGDYGTLIVNQDSVGGRSIMFNTVNGSSITHLLVNGGGGTPSLTSTPNAIDILSFTYNGSKMFWTVGNDYT